MTVVVKVVLGLLLVLYGAALCGLGFMSFLLWKEIVNLFAEERLLAMTGLLVVQGFLSYIICTGLLSWVGAMFTTWEVWKMKS